MHKQLTGDPDRCGKTPNVRKSVFRDYRFSVFIMNHRNQPERSHAKGNEDAMVDLELNSPRNNSKEEINFVS